MLRKSVCFIPLSLCLALFLSGSAGATGAKTGILSDVRIIESAEEYPGDLGYAKEEGAAFQKRILAGEEEIREALNQALGDLSVGCTLRVRDYAPSMLPDNLLVLRQNFAASIAIFPIDSGQKDVTLLRAEIDYNPAGRALRHLLDIAPLDPRDAEARSIAETARQLVQGVEGLSQEGKIVGLHDALVVHLRYEAGPYPEDVSDVCRALAEGLGSLRGYPETLHLLYSLAGLDSRIVVGQLALNSNGALRCFNKVKLDGKWYNVDALMNDPMPDRQGKVLRGYLLVNDAVMARRIEWEEGRYPAAMAEDNWHLRHGLAANSPKALRATIEEQLKSGIPFFSVWVPEYSTKAYVPIVSDALRSAFADVGKSIRISYIAADMMLRPGAFSPALVVVQVEEGKK